jgi:hypothetical protein
MNYGNGLKVMMGDKVRIGSEITGTVVCLLEAGGYSKNYLESDWSCLEEGILIEFSQLGLVHYRTKLEQDVNFVSRGPSSLK